MWHCSTSSLGSMTKIAPNSTQCIRPKQWREKTRSASDECTGWSGFCPRMRINSGLACKGYVIQQKIPSTELSSSFPPWVEKKIENCTDCLHPSPTHPFYPQAWRKFIIMRSEKYEILSFSLEFMIFRENYHQGSVLYITVSSRSVKPAIINFE